MQFGPGSVIPTSDYRWWLQKKDPHTALFAAFRWLEENDTERSAQLLQNMRLYGNCNIPGYKPHNYGRRLNKERVTLNVIKSVTDTVVAKICKTRPKPTFLTSGGNYSLRRRARLLEKYVDAQIYQSGVNQLIPDVVRDSGVGGTGILYPYREGTKIKFERVFQGEVFVDPIEAFYGTPKVYTRQKFVSRQKLLQDFPKHKAAILAAHNPSGGTDRALVGHDRLADQLEVLESWYLPTSAGSKDGRHLIAIDGATLLEEPYKYDYAPFLFLHYNKPIRGFWGVGIAENLTGIQVEINKLLARIQRAMHLLGVPWVLRELGSQVKLPQLVNEAGTVVDYSGTPPRVEAHQTVHPELFHHLDRLESKAYAQEGVSQMSAQSMKPAGLESGIALRTYNDIETERFSLFAHAYEDFYMELAKRIVDLGREIAKENPGYKVVASRDRYTISEVDWSEVDLEKDAYVLKVYPASSLPSTPAGRLAFVQEMQVTQMIDQAEAKRLLDFPDLEESMALDRATSDCVDRVIEQILDEGVYEAPEPYQDLQLTLKKSQAAYMRAINEGVPEEHLSLLRQYMTATHTHMANMAPPGGISAPGLTPPPMGPDGAPAMAVSPGDGFA